MQSLRRVHPLLWVVLILAAYAITSAAMLGNKGFVSDDWAVISFPFWYEIPQAFTESTITLRRPMQSVYHSLKLKIVDYSPTLIYFASLLTFLTASVLMGFALNFAFPKRRTLAATAALIAFSAPWLLPVGYVLNQDNLRVAAVFYWFSVLGFQYWANTPRLRSLPTIPIFMFAFALMTYESVAALPVATLMFVLPVHLRHQQNARLWHAIPLTILLVISHIVSYLIFAYVRGVYQIESHVTPVDQLSPTLIIDYIRNAIQFVGLPFSYWVINAKPLDLLLGLAIAGLVFALLILSKHQEYEETTRQWYEQNTYVIALAVILSAVGAIPFILFNLTGDVGIGREGKVYANLVYGFGIAVGLGIDHLMHSRFRIGVAVSIALWVGWMLAFQTSLRHIYNEVYTLQHSLHQSLYELVPDLEDDTTILFADYPWNYGGLPVTTEDEVDYFIQMFYQNRSIRADALTTYDTGFSPVVDGDVLAISGKRVPINQVVILERNGMRYDFVERITPDDPYVIVWHGGATEIVTNRDRVLPEPDQPSRFHAIINLTR